LARLIRKHRVGFNAFVAVLCVIAIFFTLARSVMLSLVLLHLLAFRGILWKHFSRIFIALTVIAILLVPTLLLLGRKYGFERLVATKGASMEIRRYSAIAGLKAGLNKPVLGHGPGILYWDVRQPWGMPGTTKEKVIAIENLPSAKEPHNLYILIFAESGLIGLMLLIGTILFWLHRLRLARMYSELVPDYRLESNAHWSMLIILGVFSLTSASMFIYPKVALTMWLSLLIGLHGAATVENEMLACEQYEESAQDNYYGTEQYEHLWLRDDQYV